MHSIRLRGPWEFSIPNTQIGGRVEFPCTWFELLTAAMNAGRSALLSEEKASLTLKRRFHRPTGLESGDRVWLDMVSLSPSIRAELNGTPLALIEQSAGFWRAEIVDQLAGRNELTIDLEPPCPAPLDTCEPILEATLQIVSH
jgi:hypothetical protein